MPLPTLIRQLRDVGHENVVDDRNHAAEELDGADDDHAERSDDDNDADEHDDYDIGSVI